MRNLIAALALAVLVSSPAFAQSSQRAPGARPLLPTITAPWLLGTYPRSPPGAREAALVDCNAAARQYPQMAYGHQELAVYRACMARKAHME